MTEQLVPWSVARNGVFIPYDYKDDEPYDFTFISSIDNKDLKELEIYCRLQIQYGTPKPKHELLDWSDLLKFVLVEMEFRGEIN